VYKLLKIEREVTPVYTGTGNPFQWMNALLASRK